MDDRLKHAYTKLINKHYSAVQTDTTLDFKDSWSLEKKSKQFWADFAIAEAEFKALLEQAVLSSDVREKAS
jgi:hypothetical protein